MAGRITAADVEAVRSAAQVDQIIGERVNLKRAGVGSLKGLCPFHDERTPSFNVSPQSGLWYCFGCGEGGDTIAFLMKADALSFAEAIEYLAGRSGITLHYEETGAGRERDPARPARMRLLEANRLAAEFYADQLSSPEARPARDFLRARSFDRVVADRFGVGFAPAGWDKLTRHLRGRGFAEAELAAAGLTKDGQRGPIDRFHGRIVWPIRDLTGAVVGFGARRLSEDDPNQAKYLNTPETSLYHKSQLLYGADLAKKAISRRRRVVVVEGYTDVMAAHLSGVDDAVAACGTAFGNDHIRVVRRLLGDVGSPAAGVQMSDGASIGGKVVFTFDGDEAGQQGAMRAFGDEQRFYAGTFVAVAPNGRDPCELWVDQGAEAVRELVDGAEPMFRWAIRTALKSVDLETAEGRVAGMRTAAPMVAGIRDDALRADYTRLLAGWVGQDEALVRRAVAQARSGRSGPGRRGRGPAADDDPAGGDATRPGPGWRAPRDSVGRSEHDALAAVLQLPAAVPPQFDDLAGDVFQVPELRAVHDAIRAAGGVKAAQGPGGAAAWLGQVRDFAAPPVVGVVLALAVEPLPVREGGEADYVAGVIGGLLQLGITRRLGELRSRLGRLDAAGDADGRAATLKEINELMRARDELRPD